MDRITRLFTKFNTAGCAIITSDVNRRYFTGMRSSAGVLLAFPEKAYLLIDFRYIEKARQTVTSAEVIELKKLYPQLMELMKRHGVTSAAIESETMTVSELNSYRHFFKDITIDDSDSLSTAISELRTEKDDEELVYIKKAQEIAESAYDELLGMIHPGMTERRISIELNRLMLEKGAEDISFDTIVVSGANTSMPHGVPTDKEIRQGEFLLMDFGAVRNGYHSDMTRTVCIGKPDAEMKKVYDIVLEAQLAGIAAARPGITGCELDKTARDIIERAGYGECFGHSLGHGVGLEIHEKPNAAASYRLPLNKGAVVTIEPGIYIPGKFGVRIEDFVILTENGCENLTKCEKNMVYL